MHIMHGMSAHKDTIGAQIQRRREQARKGRSELATFLGVDTSIVCRMENDEISVSSDRIQRVAEFLECTPGVLFPNARRRPKTGRKPDRPPTKAA